MNGAGTPSSWSGDEKYYDPREVDAYIARATQTIRNLQARLVEAQRHAEQGGDAGESVDLDQRLRRAGQIAERTVANAHAQAAAIVGAAEKRAAAVMAAAHEEAHRLRDGAEAAAAEVFQAGEARLMDAVGAFVEGTDILRAELARMDAEGVRARSRNSTMPT